MKSRAMHDPSLSTPEPEPLNESDRPELVDATSYDLDRLERAVADLAQRHAELSGANEELRITVAQRDSLIQKLESEIVQLGKRREAAVQRLDGLVQELDRLDVELAGGATP